MQVLSIVQRRDFVVKAQAAARGGCTGQRGWRWGLLESKINHEILLLSILTYQTRGTEVGRGRKRASPVLRELSTGKRKNAQQSPCGEEISCGVGRPCWSWLLSNSLPDITNQPPRYAELQAAGSSKHLEANCKTKSSENCLTRRLLGALWAATNHKQLRS